MTCHQYFDEFQAQLEVMESIGADVASDLSLSTWALWQIKQDLAKKLLRRHVKIWEANGGPGKRLHREAGYLPEDTV
jgi:hypothetical protein